MDRTLEVRVLFHAVIIRAYTKYISTALVVKYINKHLQFSQ